LVGEEGIEPSLRKEHDFESCAYTSSATRPKFLIPVVSIITYRNVAQLYYTLVSESHTVALLQNYEPITRPTRRKY
jgi:hypothetical protein